MIARLKAWWQARRLRKPQAALVSTYEGILAAQHEATYWQAVDAKGVLVEDSGHEWWLP